LSQPLKSNASKRARRSHAERNAETQRRIKDAVIESIGEVGYPRTTGAEIARRAGVTWGAVQHHYGDKGGILMAVLEESFERFAEVLAPPVDPTSPLEERVSRFVDRAWQHFSSDEYRTTFEILLNLEGDVEPAWQMGMLQTWQATWRRYFKEQLPSRRQEVELMHYAVSVLSGLASSKLLDGPSQKIPSRELGFLKDTLFQQLSSGPPPR
jgi:AcrR family transcriptional regulator